MLPLTAAPVNCANVPSLPAVLGNAPRWPVNIFLLAIAPLGHGSALPPTLVYDAIALYITGSS
ncbi:MAG: hypothetical protein IMX01_09410 [Limnochordaceae bacterium]|nr:hypothetical protein [Limnochordaceae bacterium]